MVFGIGSVYFVLKSVVTVRCSGLRVKIMDCAAGMTDRRAGPHVMRMDCVGAFNREDILILILHQLKLVT